MADYEEGSDSDESQFGDIINQLMRQRAQGLGNDNQSDISVSSVHTSDLSDINNNDISDLEFSSDDDLVSEWTDDISNPYIQPFVSSVGPRKPLPYDAKPIDYFYQLFPDDLFAKIVDETNLYADQNRHRGWQPISVPEMKAYLGILFLMGVIQLPGYRYYWSTRPTLRNSVIAKIMTVNRYEQITRALHLNDSTTNPPRNQPGHDKLHKVRPVLDNVKNKFPAHYHPHQNVAVDEAMVKFKGRCSFLQYIPSKPCKWGIKAWALADSESFYLIDFDVYTGKEVEQRNNIPLGTRVVTKLVEPFYGKWHHVYFDNYFTSVELEEHLLKKKTYSCGTVRLNRRGLPDQMKTVKLKNTGDMLKMQKGKLLAVAWQEKKRQVNVLSTANSTGNTLITRKGKRGQPDTTYPKPVAIQEYTENYNAVDKNDQLRSYYGIANRAKKWWKYIFWFVLDVTVINAYVLHIEAPGGPRPKPLTHLDFHLDVAEGLINGFTSRKRVATMPMELQHVSKKPTKHIPTKIQTKRGQRNCVRCATAKVRTPAGNSIQSSYECKSCGVALCKDSGCFAAFHNYNQ